MIQLSIILARIAQSGRSVAFHPNSLRSFSSATGSRARASSSAIFAVSDDPEDSNVNVNGAEGGQPQQPQKPQRPKGGARRRKIQHQSRLASIYDEMFADDDNDDGVSSGIDNKNGNVNRPQQQYQRQDTYQYDEFDYGDKPNDILMNDDFPQDLHVTFDSDSPSPPSSPSPPRRPEARRPPGKVPPRPTGVDTGIGTGTGMGMRTSQSQSQSSQPQFKPPPMNRPPPPRAGRQLARPIPPGVLEYDYSHYDPEFGERKAGENSYIEFHDGMLEELGDTLDMTPPEVKRKREEQQKQQQLSQQQQVNLDSNISISQPTIQSEVKVVDSKFDGLTTTVNAEKNEEPFYASLSSPATSSTTTESELEVDQSDDTDSATEGDELSIRSESTSNDSIPTTTIVAVDETISENKKEDDLNSSYPEYMPPRPTAKASNLELIYSSPRGDSQVSQVEMLEEQLEKTQTEIYSLNDGIEFNVKSPKQVSKVLFGVDNESTNKDALEALAGGISNHTKARLSSLILKYRRTVSEIKRLNKTKENKLNGVHVTTTDSMKRGNSPAESAPDPGVKITTLREVAVASPMEADDSTKEPLVLVDASAYIFRAYYSMPAIHRYDGEPTGATLGFCNMLNNLVLTPLLRGEQPRIALIFDSKDGTNFRKEIYPEYKSNRQACPEDLIPQFDFVRDAADAYGILQLEAPGYEADDVIATVGTMALNEGCHVNILSGDKDLMQLVTKNKGGACIEMIDPMKKVRFSHEGVIEKWGVEPHLVGDILALAGDSADNIPGVPGIGPKIAAQLIQEFGSLDGLLNNLDNVKQKGRQQKLRDNVSLANLSRKLVELERNISLEAMSFPTHLESVSDIRMERFDSDRLIKFYERMGFKDLKKRVRSRLPNNKQPPPSVLDRYSSISEDAKGKRRARKPAPSLLDRYSSIADDTNSQAESKSKPQPETKYDKGNGFSTPNFKQPPKPEDFSDVPF